jgi:uncharacterized protein (DUF302 family)
MNITFKFGGSMKINKSKAPARGWVKKALCGSALLGLGLALGIQSVSASEYGHSKSISFSPFSRVATMPVVQTGGAFDKGATADRAKRAAQALGFYLATVNEAIDTTDTFKGGNWILGGYEVDPLDPPLVPTDVAGAILGIPTPPGPLGQKVNVLDLCNKTYASMALGVKPIIGGDTPMDSTDDKFVVNGYSHATALPCEVAIHYDDENIYVDMLDPSAIFKLFFSDVIFSDEMKDDEFAAAIQAMPPQVKEELKAIIYSALEAFAMLEDGGAGISLDTMDKGMGPAYESIGDIIRTVHQSPQQSPYKHVAYTRNDGVFVGDDAKRVTQAIIEAMSIHGEDGITDPTRPKAGTHPWDVDNILSADSQWRSARHSPLGLPGKPEKNWVIEACSPTYAKKAMGTGTHHATALPCEISVQRVDLDSDGSTESLVISYLDPYFMFGAMFSDMTDEEKAALGDIPGYIIDDLQFIVKHALDTSGIDLNDGVQIKYNMLPGKKSGKKK